jgi:hypothetical protein
MSNEINIDDLLGDDNLTPPSHGKEEPKQSSYSKPAYNESSKKSDGGKVYLTRRHYYIHCLLDNDIYSVA